MLESIAPGQGEELWNYLQSSSITGLGNSDNDCDDDEEISPNTFSDNTLRNLIDAYNNAQSSKSRKEILSIFAQNFKRKQLKDLIPGLTDFRIKEARKHCKEHGSGTAVPTAPVHRFFLNEDKVDHFLRFITSDMISQDTAYGTSKLKLESGVELVIPKPIRKLIPARIIAQYLVICDESGVKGCQVSVVEMPQRSSQTDTNVKIKGISQIHNIPYEEGGKHLTLEKENAWYKTICRQLKFQRLRYYRPFRKHTFPAEQWEGIPNTLKRKRPHLQILKTFKVMHYLSALLMGVLALLIRKQSSRGTWMLEIMSVAYTESLSWTA